MFKQHDSNKSKQQVDAKMQHKILALNIHFLDTASHLEILVFEFAYKGKCVSQMWKN